MEKTLRNYLGIGAIVLATSLGLVGTEVAKYQGEKVLKAKTEQKSESDDSKLENDVYKLAEALTTNPVDKTLLKKVKFKGKDFFLFNGYMYSNPNEVFPNLEDNGTGVFFSEDGTEFYLMNKSKDKKDTKKPFLFYGVGNGETNALVGSIENTVIGDRVRDSVKYKNKDGSVSKEEVINFEKSANSQTNQNSKLEKIISLVGQIRENILKN